MRLVKEWFKLQNEPQPEYRCVIVGAGSGGCVTAYTIGKKMAANNLTGKVLLIDSGRELKHQGYTQTLFVLV